MDNEVLEDKNDDEEDKKHFLEGKEGGREAMLRAHTRRARGRRQEGKNNKEKYWTWRSVRNKEDRKVSRK